jgi:hypothetical protein
MVTMHPEIARAVADARHRDLIRAAEDWRRVAEARTATATPKDASARVPDKSSSLLRRLRTWRWHPAYR